MTDAEREARRKEAWDLLDQIEKGWDNGFGTVEADLIEKFAQRAEQRGREKIEKELMAELRDPCGTIWEHAKKLQDDADNSYHKGLLRGAEIVFEKREIDKYKKCCKSAMQDNRISIAEAIRKEAERREP